MGRMGTLQRDAHQAVQPKPFPVALSIRSPIAERLTVPIIALRRITDAEPKSPAHSPAFVYGVAFGILSNNSSRTISVDNAVRARRWRIS